MDKAEASVILWLETTSGLPALPQVSFATGDPVDVNETTSQGTKTTVHFCFQVCSRLSHLHTMTRAGRFGWHLSSFEAKRLVLVEWEGGAVTAKGFAGMWEGVM